jgi:hypothetical protein
MYVEKPTLACSREFALKLSVLFSCKRCIYLLPNLQIHFTIFRQLLLPPVIMLGVLIRTYRVTSSVPAKHKLFLSITGKKFFAFHDFILNVYAGFSGNPLQLPEHFERNCIIFNNYLPMTR